MVARQDNEIATKAAKDQRPSARERIIAAAVRRFRTVGISATTMTDIAEEAGVSRPTVYRLFVDRSALLKEILSRRFKRVFDAARIEYQTYGSLKEALVEGPIFAIYLHRSDTFFVDMLQHATDRRIEDFVLMADAEIRAINYSVWQPLFNKARGGGELNSELSNERLAEGVRSMAALVALRSDLDEAGKRLFLSDFLVPAIVGTVPCPDRELTEESAISKLKREKLERAMHEAMLTMSADDLRRLIRIAEVLQQP